MNSLENHTLFILTRNRSQWIEYSLNFYDYFKYLGKILIADDSDDDYFERNSRIIENFKDRLKIKHIRGEGRNFLTRKKRFCFTRYYAIQMIDTEYYSQTGDDDILYTPDLFKAINFLNKNKDYTYVQGSTLQVYFDKYLNIENLSDTWWPECDYEDPLDRISHYTQNSGCPLLGVNRVKPIKDLLEIEKKLGWPPFSRKNNDGLEYFDEELPWALHIYASGKIGRIKDCFLYFRLKTKTTEKEDRIENLHLHDDLKNNYVVGPIANIYDNSMTNCLIESQKEISSIIHYYGTKYNKQDVEFQISQCLWSLISRYSGAGLNKIKIKFSEDNLKNNTNKFYLKFFKFIRNILTKLKNIKFYIKLRKKKLLFNEFHIKLKNKIFENK